MKRKLLAAVVALAVLIVGAILVARNRPSMQQDSRFMMDTYCTIRVPGPAPAREAITRAFERMADIDRRFNALNPASPVYRFNTRGEPISDADIVALVQAALTVSERTGGAFDITVQPLVELWGFYSQAPAVPSPERIAETLRTTGWQRLAIENGRVIRRDDSIRIDLGGIAKGYAVAEAVRVLKEAGIRSALVDAGGDIYAFGLIKDRPWRVGVRNPRGEGIIGILELSDESTATSGDYERFFEQDGKRYHHILDPATGYPAQEVISAMILSRDATLADAWSTAVFVLGAERGLECLKRVPGVEAMIVTRDGKRRCSPGLESRLREPRDGATGPPSQMP